MIKTELVLKIKLKWWLKLYLKGLTLFCKLTGEVPDWDKVESVCKNGFIILHNDRRLK